MIFHVFQSFNLVQTTRTRSMWEYSLSLEASNWSIFPSTIWLRAQKFLHPSPNLRRILLLEFRIKFTIKTLFNGPHNFNRECPIAVKKMSRSCRIVIVVAVTCSVRRRIRNFGIMRSKEMEKKTQLSLKTNIELEGEELVMSNPKIHSRDTIFCIPNENLWSNWLFHVQVHFNFDNLNFIREVI